MHMLLKSKEIAFTGVMMALGVLLVTLGGFFDGGSFSQYFPDSGPFFSGGHYISGVYPCTAEIISCYIFSILCLCACSGMHGEGMGR